MKREVRLDFLPNPFKEAIAIGELRGCNSCNSQKIAQVGLSVAVEGGRNLALPEYLPFREGE